MSLDHIREIELIELSKAQRMTSIMHYDEHVKAWAVFMLNNKGLLVSSNV